MASPPPPLSTVTNSQPSSPPPSSSQMVLVISIGVVVVMILIVLFVIICWITKKRVTAAGTRRRLATVAEPPKRTQFTFEQLSRATAGFSNSNILVGTGRFGAAYKGLLPNQRQVVVKRLKPINALGLREFQNEVAIISKLHHKHLVFFLGYCTTPKLLVFNFLPNNTLHFHLHVGGERPVMQFATRLRIAIGTAKALAYLHEDSPVKIIHRDIKAANILLDSNFEAIVAYFGLSKTTYNDATYVSTRVNLTSKYLAPEYAFTRKLTRKTDVFSYGVILLELITGLKPEAMNLDRVRPLLSQVLEDGNFDPIVDPNLQPNYSHDDMTKMLTCADVCVSDVPMLRPRMSMVVRVLEGAASVWELKFGSSRST